MTLATNDLVYGVPNFIVDAIPGRGTHQTIAAAFSESSPGFGIAIRPGVYSENLNVPPGVKVWAEPGDEQLGTAIIFGKLTMNGSVSSTFSNIRLMSNSDNILDVTGLGGNSSGFYNCFFVYSAATAIVCDNPSASLIFKDCLFSQVEDNISLFILTEADQFSFINCNEFSGLSVSGVSNIADTGDISFAFCKMGGQRFTTTASGGYRFNDCYWRHGSNKTFLTTAGTGTCWIENVTINSGTSAAISIGSGTTAVLRSVNIESSNENPITGAGTLIYDAVTFSGTGTGINATSTTIRSGIKSTWLGSTIEETKGGTGQETYSTGDILYASSANNLSKLPSGVSGTILKIDSGIPSWKNSASTVGFSVYNSADQINVTGSGTNYTVDFNTKSYDPSNNFDLTNNLFSVPVSGRYLFVATINIQSLSSAMTSSVLRIGSIGADYIVSRTNPYEIRDILSGITVINVSVIANLTIGNTVSLKLQVSGGAGDTVTIDGGQFSTQFSGTLLS